MKHDARWRQDYHGGVLVEGPTQQKRFSFIRDFGWLPDGYLAQHREHYDVKQESRALTVAYRGKHCRTGSLSGHLNQHGSWEPLW